MTFTLYTLENEFIKETANPRMPPDFSGYVSYGKNKRDYFLDGDRHRIGGPAYICNNEIEYYYICGKLVTKEQHDLLYSIMKLKGLLC